MDIESRIKKARSAFGILSPVWRNANLSTGLKLRLFKSNVVSVLLYGCCTWKVTSIVTSRLQIFVNRCLRKILRIYWPNNISNTELLRRAHMKERLDCSHPSQRRKMYAKKSYEVEPFNQFSKAIWQSPRNIGKN